MTYTAQPPHDGQQQPYPQHAPVPQTDEKTPAILAHVSSLIAMFLSVGWLSFLGPFIIWLMYKDKSNYVRTAAAGSFNFNFSMFILNIIGWVCFFTIIGIPLAIIFWIASFLGQVIFHTIAAVKASNGEQYRYPMPTPILR